MNWQSWSDFFLMGGYAFYVWGSLAVFVFVIGFELYAISRREQRALAFISAAPQYQQFTEGTHENAA